EGQEFPDCEAGETIGGFRQIAKPGARTSRVAIDIETADTCCAAIGGERSCYEPHSRGLAGAVWPQKAGHRTGCRAKADIYDRFVRSKAFAKSASFNFHLRVRAL